MANYNLTNQPISSSFGQLLQKDVSTGTLYDGTGSVVSDLDITSSYALTASYAENVVDPTWDNIQDKPSGLVSSSVQVSDITGSSLVNASTDYSNITFTKGDGTTFEVDSTPRQVIEQVKNSNGFMPKGTPVYVSGSTGNSLNVYQADAGDATRVPATFILNQDLDPGEEGIGILSGFINGVNTSAFAEGANIYLAVGGGYTDVQPTGSAYIQKLGNVVKSEINGSGVISGAGRVNALPNIQEGYLWVGDSNGVPTTVASSSITPTPEGVATTGSNTFVGDQTISGSVTIQDTNAPMSGLVLKNNSGGGDVQIIPAGDLITTFNSATLTGLDFIDASALSGSTHYIGKSGDDIRIKNLQSTAISTIDLGFGLADADYALQLRSGSNNAHFKGDVDVDGSTNVIGDVTGSTFTGSFVGDGTGLTLDSNIAYTNQSNTFTQPQIISGDTEITASSVSSPALKVWDGGYTDGGQPFPIIQTYSSNDRAASGVAVEVAGGTFFAPGLSSEPLDADTYPLRVTDGTEPRITVLSQNDAAATQTNIELNGNTFIGGVDKNVIIEAQAATGGGNVEIIGNAVSITSSNPLTFNSGVTINGATLINSGIYNSNATLSNPANPFAPQIGNNADYWVLEVDNGQQVNLNMNSVLAGFGRTIRLLISQGVTPGTVAITQGTGNPYEIIGPSGSFSGGNLTVTNSAGAYDYFEFTHIVDRLIITTWLPNASSGTF